MLDGKNLSHFPHQKLQNFIFHRGQLNLFPVNCHFFIGVVQLQSACFVHICPFHIAAKGRVAPQLGLHPGDHLQRIKGLCDIIVSADSQSHNFIVVLGLCRQENNRNVRGLTDFQGCVNPVHFGHHDVHQYKMNGIFRDNFQRFFSGIGLENSISLVFQVKLQRVDNFPLVITY